MRAVLSSSCILIRNGFPLPCKCSCRASGSLVRCYNIRRDVVCDSLRVSFYVERERGGEGEGEREALWSYIVKGNANTIRAVSIGVLWIASDRHAYRLTFNSATALINTRAAHRREINLQWYWWAALIEPLHRVPSYRREERSRKKVGERERESTWY